MPSLKRFHLQGVTSCFFQYHWPSTVHCSTLQGSKRTRSQAKRLQFVHGAKHKSSSFIVPLLFYYPKLSNDRLPDPHPISNSLAGGHGRSGPGDVEEGVTPSICRRLNLLPQHPLPSKGGVAGGSEGSPGSSHHLPYSNILEIGKLARSSSHRPTAGVFLSPSLFRTRAPIHR